MPSHNTSLRQAGFGLVEIMVGLAIGMLATLVIMQVFSVFEGQKRTTTGNADAQTNGSIALHSIQREALMAGFGLPVFDSTNSPMKCTAFTPAGSTISPVSITDGGTAAGASDKISLRYGTSQMGGIPIKINGLAGAIAGVDNNLGCQNLDTVIVTNGTSCAITTVNDTGLAADTTHITLSDATGVTVGASLACMGGWSQIDFEIDNNQMERNDVPVVVDIVNIQAQYGISAIASSNQVTQWVDASGGTWAAPSPADRNRIKAIRVAVVARNGLMEKDNVTAGCSSLTAASPTGLCAWEGSAASPAPAIDLSNDVNWQRYRYRVFETIIPLRNVIWSKGAL